jgi:hypothetical protein
MSTTTGTFPGVRIVDMPDLGAVNDSSSVVGERAGSGRFNALALRGYTNMVTATGSTTPRSSADRWSTIANVFDYGAIGDGVADDTAAIQAAVATGHRVHMPRPSVAYRVTNAINCVTAGQVIEGDGKGVTIITVPATFNMAALGVFVAAPAGLLPGPQFRDFEINFQQPDTTDNAALNHYPVAFFSQGVGRGTWHRIKINAANKGIDLRLNGAGVSIVDCELCCFDWHIYLDGEQDSVTVQSCRFENDALTANQSTLYHAQAVGILSGRCDDLHVIGCLFYCALGIQLIVGADGTRTTFGNITNCDFDTYSGINMANGNVEVAGCAFTFGAAATSYGVQMTGGNMSVSACWFDAGVTMTNPMIGTTNAAGVFLQLSGCRFDLVGNTAAVACYQQGVMMLTGCQFRMEPVARTAAVITINDGVQLSMNGCRFTPRGGGSGGVLNVPNDGMHNVCGNVLGGWAVTMGAGAAHVFANNNP